MRQHIVAQDSVTFHFLTLLIGQQPGLEENRIGNGNFADIVEGRCVLEQIRLLLTEAVGQRQLVGVLGYPLFMVAGLLRTLLTGFRQSKNNLFLGVLDLLLQGHRFQLAAGIGGRQEQMLLVGIAELSGRGHFIDCLVYSDHLTGRAANRQGQNIAGTIAGLLIYIFVKTLILVGVVYNQRFSVVRNIPGNPLV